MEISWIRATKTMSLFNISNVCQVQKLAWSFSHIIVL
jgi:hypothetical protein